MNTYDRITERIIALLEQGTVPWHQPWAVKTGPPRNLVSQKPYRGVNVLLLTSMGYESPHWLTFRQAVELGGNVRRGEKSCPVVFWKRLKVEDEDTDEARRIPLLRLYYVFNAAQCEGLKPKDTSAEVPATVTRPAEIVAGMPQPPEIRHGKIRAYYSPALDYVGLPEPKWFNSEAEYYGTLFHELVHATGHEKRLKRQSITERSGFGSDPYCKEELVAEIGSAFLCGHAEILDRTIDSSAAYLQNWLRQLKGDRTLIVGAAAQAQRAVDFILGTTFAESEAAHE